VRLLEFVYQGSEEIEGFSPHFVTGVAQFIREMLQDPEVLLILRNLEPVVKGLL
jgi:hypothetical protein